MYLNQKRSIFLGIICHKETRKESTKLLLYLHALQCSRVSEPSYATEET